MRAVVILAGTLLVSTAACSDLAQQTTSPNGDEVLAGTLTGAVTVFGIDGGVARGVIPRTSFSARLHRGIARCEWTGGGALAAPSFSAAVADAAGEGAHRTIRRDGVDHLGRKHTLEFIKAGRRGVLFTHYIAGVRQAMIVNKWKREGDLWVLDGAQITMFDKTGEGILSRAELTAGDIRRAGSRSALRAASGFLKQIGHGLGPTPLAAQELVDGAGEPIARPLPPPGPVEEPSIEDPSQYYPPDDGVIYHPELEAAFYASGPNCESIKARMFGYLVVGVLACGSTNLFACAGAALGYWGAYDTYIQNCT